MAADDLNGNLTIVEKDQLFAEVAKLPADDKLELLKLIIPQPIAIVGGAYQMSGNIIVQINMADSKTIADVLEVLGDRLKNS